MPATLTAKELRERRKTTIEKAQSYLDQNTDDDGKATKETLKTFDEMLDAAQEDEDMAQRLESLARLKAAADPVDPEGGAPPKRMGEQHLMVRKGRDAKGLPRYVPIKIGARGTDEYREAFDQFLRYGYTGMPHEQRATLQSDNAERAGYFLASEQLAAGILKEVDDMLFVRQLARIHTVREADSLGIRKRTARMETWGWTSELQVSTADSSLKYGKKVLTPHHATGLVKVSRDLLRRSVVSVEEEITFEMARDSGELMEDGYFTGTGDRQPLGVFTASSDGISTSRDSSSGSSTSITADALLDAKYKLKAQYRNGGTRAGARWLFHRDGIKIIAKLKDANNQYLMRTGQGLRGDDPDMLLGFPIDESERCPNTFTTGLYVGLLGNWAYYEIADALDMDIQVLTELYAATNEVGYIGRLKTDGMPTLEEAFVRLKTD